MMTSRRTFLTGTAGLGVALGLGTAGATSASAATTLAERIYNRARTMAGKKYVWGGESLAEGGFDCSGIIQWAYRVETGVTLPRVASQQIASTKLRVLRRKVAIMEAKNYVKPMQVVFFHQGDGSVGHVAIATGGDTFFGANYFSAASRELTYYVAANGVNSSTFTRYGTINTTWKSVKDRGAKPYTHVTIAEWIEPAAPRPTSTVTKTVAAGIRLNVRASASTKSLIVGRLSGGTKVTGTITGSWMKITSGTYAGRHVSASYLR